RLKAAGHTLAVWSRSGVPVDADDLSPYAKTTPREAVAAADIVISMVTDDEASQSVWLGSARGALAATTPGSVVIESSTLSPAWVASLARQAKARGVHYLDAPVVGSRPQADAGALVYLVGGDAMIVDRVRPIFAALASAAHHVGDAPSATVTKLAVNASFAAQVALTAELIGMIRHSGLNVEAVMEVLGTLPVTSPASKAAAAAMQREQFAPLFPIGLVQKDLRYAIAAARALGCGLPIVERTGELFEQAAVRGFAHENITAIAKLY
ncbi:MAG: NAD(P)-dependent oxidoreductase, partial [Clostridia bacterium]|nr:NAD(P)-dependent oxidoreductase [Deltaproteobacteria bacterium]